MSRILKIKAAFVVKICLGTFSDRLKELKSNGNAFLGTISKVRPRGPLYSVRGRS